jgi:hypothetical protein
VGLQVVGCPRAARSSSLARCVLAQGGVEPCSRIVQLIGEFVEPTQSALNTTPIRVSLDQTRRQSLMMRSLSNIILNVARMCSFVGNSIPAPSAEMLNTRQRWLPPSPKMYAAKSTSERSIFRRFGMLILELRGPFAVPDYLMLFQGA